MPRKVKYKDENYTLYPKTGGSQSIESKDQSDSTKVYTHTTALVSTCYGFVPVCTHYYKNLRNDKVSQFSWIEIIKDGRLYFRRYEKALSIKGLTTKAKQFAKEIYAKRD